MILPRDLNPILVQTSDVVAERCPTAPARPSALRQEGSDTFSHSTGLNSNAILQYIKAILRTVQISFTFTLPFLCLIASEYHTFGQSSSKAADKRLPSSSRPEKQDFSAFEPWDSSETNGNFCDQVTNIISL